MGMLGRIARRTLAGLAGLALAAAPAAAQGPPVSIGTNPPGTVFYAVGSGLAKVVSEGGKVRMTVQPYTGSSTFIPLLNTAEMAFGVTNAVDMALAYRGPGFTIGGRTPFPPAPNLRLAMRGSPLLASLLVRKDSPIRTVHDIKGKRMTGEFPAHLSVWYNTFGYLASAGLTWSDVKVVPVPAINDGVDALVQGRPAVPGFAMGGARVKEADVAVGVRHVSIDCSPGGEARLRKAVPGYYPRVVKAGTATGVVEDTCVIAYDLYLAVARSVAEPVVEASVRALWEGIAKLGPLHPQFKEGTPERAGDPEVTIPYHPGAVRFYREQGVWTPQMEQAQQRLLALNP